MRKAFGSSQFLLFTGLFVIAAPAAASLIYSGAGGDFNPATFDVNQAPVPATTTFDIPVTDSATINPGDSVSVDLFGLQYPYAADLEVSLSLYDDSNNLLMSGDLFNQIGIVMAGDPGYGPQFGTSPGGNGEYSFDSSSTGDLWNTAFNLASSDTIPNGTYWTSSAASGDNDELSTMFGGLPINGTWVLTVTDNYPPFNGGPALYNPGITSWDVNIQATAAPEPSMTLAVGFATLLWIMRRRKRA